ncbi:MAG: helix-turn-helix domain-containing protein [Gammaproteobacteria bacterium]|nr:helix-turn-helix domain-containing protein [Pseudomonadales bacterium]
MTLYTTQQVADLLDLHVKTVRGYVKDGRLRSTRLGKQYRIARKDLEAFLGKSLDVSPAAVTPQAEVSSIVELEGIGNQAASRLSNLMMTAARGHREERPLRVETLFDPERNRLKLIVIGSLEATVTLLQMIDRLNREQ